MRPCIRGNPIPYVRFLTSSMRLSPGASEKSSCFYRVRLTGLLQPAGVAVLTTADSSSDSMCLALGFPRCAFNRLTEQVMGARGDLAGSLQPGGLVMWATVREAPTRVVGWACYCMGGFLLLVSSRSLLLVGVRSHSCVCFFGLLAGDLSDVACNAWACTAGLSGPARAASFASPSVSRRWRSRGFPNCRKSGRLGGLALRCSAALRIN